jgi:hypothetical protein
MQETEVFLLIFFSLHFYPEEGGSKLLLRPVHTALYPKQLYCPQETKDCHCNYNAVFGIKTRIEPRISDALYPCTVNKDIRPWRPVGL